MTAARITEPAVGASVCASGSQVCTGNSGTLMANAIAKPQNSQRPASVEIAWFCAISTRLKGSCPPTSLWFRTASATSATSMNAEPNIVYRKNFVAAYTRRPCPHRPIR